MIAYANIFDRGIRPWTCVRLESILSPYSGVTTPWKFNAVPSRQCIRLACSRVLVRTLENVPNLQTDTACHPRKGHRG